MQIEVAQAQDRAEAAQAVASHEIHSLRSQLEILRNEIMELKRKIPEVIVRQVQSQAIYGAAWFQNAMKELESIVQDLRDSNVVARLNSIESKINDLKQQLHVHRSFLQELWLQRPNPLFLSK